MYRKFVNTNVVRINPFCVLIKIFVISVSVRISLELFYTEHL